MTPEQAVLTAARHRASELRMARFLAARQAATRCLSPGIYKATVRGVPETTVLIDDDGDGVTMTSVNGAHGHNSNDITDAHPLIVLDLDGAEREYVQDLRYAANALRQEHDVHCAFVVNLADQIEAQA